jgi:two-component system chemotaxis response regulator CheY
LTALRPSTLPAPADSRHQELPVNRTALIVDDSASIRAMLAFTLQEAGYAVLQADDGQNATKVLDGRKIDLVITDLNMPRMDGFGLIKHIRAQPAYRFIPILMLTTVSNEDRKAEGKKTGATAWLVKPFDPGQLMAVVAKVVR